MSGRYRATEGGWRGRGRRLAGRMGLGWIPLPVRGLPPFRSLLCVAHGFRSPLPLSDYSSIPRSAAKNGEEGRFSLSFEMSGCGRSIYVS
jgi:hypothetical protein